MVILTLIVFKLLLPLLPFKELGIKFTLGINNLLMLTLLLTPLALFSAALQTIVATFSKSYKEAQTYVGVIFLVPMIPSMLLMLLPIKEKLWMMSIPILSQNLLINQLLRGETIDLIAIIITIISSLVAGILLSLVAIKLFSREKILFSSST